MGKCYMEADEEALRNFLLDEDCLNQLLPWTGRFNIFDVLKISRTEIRHSNMLGWLLDPNENHGLGDRYLRALFQLIVNNNSKHNVFEMLLLDYYSFKVYREWKNIDILIVSSEDKVLIAIENKVGSHEHGNQLNRYRHILEKEYDEYKRVYLYLTPDGEFSSDPKNWETLTYQELIDELENISGHIDLLPDVELMIRNYVEVVRRDLVEDQELVDICNKIYEKHKRALDLIFLNKTDNKSMIKDVLLETLKEYENRGLLKVEAATVSNTMIAFSTDKMNKYLPEDDQYTNTWGTHTIYRYYILIRNYPDLVGIFEIGGSNFGQEVAPMVDKITHILKPNDNRKEFKYKRLYSSKRITVDEDNMEESCQKVIGKIVNDLLHLQENILKKIEE